MSRDISQDRRCGASTPITASTSRDGLALLSVLCKRLTAPAYAGCLSDPPTDLSDAREAGATARFLSLREQLNVTGFPRAAATGA